MQKNIVYGNISAGGNVHIGDKIYIVERDFTCSILFLRIEKSEFGYQAMLSVKADDGTMLLLLRQAVLLAIPDTLFWKVKDFQNFRRGIGEVTFRGGIETTLSNLEENTLTYSLYDSFFEGDVGQVCRDFLGLLQRRKISELLLVISTEDNRIKNLPWEMVLPKLGPGDNLPPDNFGLIRTSERSVEWFDKQGPTVSTAPIKLLFIPALPENLSENAKMLQIEAEQKSIIKAVRGLEATGPEKPRLVMEILDCANLDEIKEALAARSHDIVHISGHGAFVEAVKEGLLYLEDEDGNEQKITGRALGKALHPFSSIKLLVLSACETAVGGPEGSIAEQMATATTEGRPPAILAMRFAVTDSGARLFTKVLYTRLANGETLTKAMHDARQSLWEIADKQRRDTPNHPVLAEWFTPVLYQNQVIGSLVKGEAYDPLTRDRFYPGPALDGDRLVGAGYIGRKRLMIRLRKAFDAGKAVCLHGLGGLGKTTTATAFAEHYRQRHGHDVLLFSKEVGIQQIVILDTLFRKWKATQPGNFQVDQLDNQLKNSDTTPEHKLQLLINKYLNTHRTILIFDNMEDVQTGPDNAIGAEGLRSFLQYLLDNVPDDCPVLFTTRYLIPDLSDQVTHIPIDKLTYAEQYRYINFSDKLRQLPTEARAILDRRVDGHPRALEFLEGIYRRNQQFDLADFDASIGDVETRIFENLLLQRLFDQLTEIERTVFEAASVLVGRSPVAALSALLEQPTETLGPVLMDLRDGSLCFYDEAEQTIEVHTLTRAWMRQQQHPKPEQLKALAYRAGVYFGEQPMISNAILAKSYFEQAEAWNEYTSVAFKLEDYCRLIGYYSLAERINIEILGKNLSSKINADAENNIGLIFLSTGKYAQAYVRFKSSLSAYRRINYKKGEAMTLDNISHIHSISGHHNKAMLCLKKSLTIRKNIGDKLGEGCVLNNISQIYHEQGNDDKALTYLKKCLLIQVEEKDKIGEANTHNNFTEIYRLRRKFDKALYHAHKSLTINNELRISKGISDSYNHLGTVFMERSSEQSDTERAISYFQQSLAIRRQIGDKHGEGVTLCNIGMVYIVQSDYETALSFFSKSLKVQRDINHQNGTAIALYSIGLLYLVKKGDAVSALIPLYQSHTIFKNIKSPYTNQSLKYIQTIRWQIGEERFNQIIQSLPSTEK